MTSSVKVTAHCTSNKEVVFTVGGITTILQDGQSDERSIYDSLAALVTEREKGVVADVGVEPSFGQKAVGYAFNPSGDDAVASIKRIFASAIDQLNDLRVCSVDQEVKRLASIAITEAQSAQMWAVKACTWK